MAFTPKTPQEFIQSLAPHAQEVQRKYGVPASIAIAQAALETGWGKSVKGNNIYGVKEGSGWKGDTVDFTTQEEVNGRRVTITDRFRAYGSIKESMQNYAQLLSGSKLYSRVMHADNAYEAADELRRAGYATDSAYAGKLKSIISQYNLTQFDDPSYRGYTEGERFNQTRDQLRIKREAEPKVWNDFMQTFLGMLGALVAGISNMVFGRVDDVKLAFNGSAPATPPSAQARRNPVLG